jgi:hypothetical protein
MPIRRGALLLILLAGCVSSEPSRPSVSWQSLKPESDPGPDRVLFDVALVRRPLGDPFLADELWASADEMIVSADLRELLELNGYRVGVLVGAPPDKLLQLLQSERSCPERRGRTAPSGKPLTQNLCECSMPVDVFVHIGKSKDDLALDRPQFGLDLTPFLHPNGAVRLKVTPRLEDGDKAINYKALPEESKWALEVKRPTRAFAALAFDIDLAPNQILLIGPRLEREGSLGFQSLTEAHAGDSLQHLLILRNVRSKAAPPFGEMIEIANPANPPLALQAPG